MGMAFTKTRSSPPYFSLLKFLFLSQTRDLDGGNRYLGDLGVPTRGKVVAQLLDIGAVGGLAAH